MTKPASGALALVIPLPTAASARVQQPPRRGPYPKAIIRLYRVRQERSMRAWQQQEREQQAAALRSDAARHTLIAAYLHERIRAILAGEDCHD